MGSTDPETWRLRFDVVGVDRVGTSMLAVRTVTTAVGGPADRSFSSPRVVFSGHFYDSDAHRPLILDRTAGQSLPMVIDGKGDKLGSDPATGTMTTGQSLTNWLMFPLPKSYAQGEIELYVPAFGLLTVPVAS